METKLTGKVAIVTGGSRGLGKSMAIELARAGADIVVVARTVEAGQSKLPGTIHETVQEIEQSGGGGKAVSIRCDVTKEDDVNQMVQQVIDQFGHVDILVNNAGIGMPRSFLKTTAKNWDLLMNVNLKGTFLCSGAVLPHMIEQGSGNIINLSSILAVKIKYSIVYGASKAAIERLTLGMAKEMIKYNISVNALRPGFTVTEAVQTELPDLDTSDWQSPEMWGKYTAMTAALDADTLTGKILDEPALKEIFGAVTL